MRYIRLISTVILILIFKMGFSQIEFPPLSHQGKIIQEVGNTFIKVEYERPSARGRNVFGSLVPWDEIWRTGASYCTKISFSSPVVVEGQSIDAGTYSLFTIPNQEEWMVILNRDTTLYGAYYYDKNKDAARFNVKSFETTRYYESLTIDIDVVPNDAMIYISWMKTSIGFKVDTGLDDEIMDFINNTVETIENAGEDDLAMSMDYLYFQNKDFRKLEKLGLELIEKYNSGFACRVLMESYIRNRYYEKALEIAKTGYEIRKNRTDIDEKYLERDLKEWSDAMKLIHEKLKIEN